VGGLGGVHRPDAGVAHCVQLGVDVGGRQRHSVSRGGDRCHGSTQALTTDSQRPRTLVLTGMWTLSEDFSEVFSVVVSRLASLAPQPPQPRPATREAAATNRPPYPS
jgi:hypothetical protein